MEDWQKGNVPTSQYLIQIAQFDLSEEDWKKLGVKQLFVPKWQDELRVCTFNLPRGLKQKIVEVATEENLSQSELIRRILEKHFFGEGD